MRILAKILSSKLFALAVLVGVGVWLLVIPAFTGRLGANPVEKLLHQTGEIAIWTLGAVLALTPLRVLFPQSPIVSALNKHRRWIGVTSCIYGVLHFACHFLYEGSLADVQRSFSKPFILLGAGGLLLLIILALTSNNWSMRKLGKRWKLLHRLAYLAAIVLIIHQAIAGKGHWQIARWLLFSLLALEAARVFKNYLKKRKSRVPSPVQAV